MPDEVKVKLAEHFNISLDYFFGLIDKELPHQDKNTISLPKDFTQDMIDKVNHYIALLELELKENNKKTEEEK